MYRISALYECTVQVALLSEVTYVYPLFQSHLFSKVNIPASGIITIDPSLPVNDCAEDYERKLKEV